MLGKRLFQSLPKTLAQNPQIKQLKMAHQPRALIGKKIKQPGNGGLIGANLRSWYLGGATKAIDL